jgi:hypothetical protein
MSRINNYDDLLTERKRLEGEIQEQKKALKLELGNLKEKLAPFLNLLPVLNIFRKKDPGAPLISTISSLGIDLVGHTLLSKANWLTKFIVPLIAKGISSRVIHKNKIPNSTIGAQYTNKQDRSFG